VSVSLTVKQRDVLAVLATHPDPISAQALSGLVGVELAGLRRSVASLIRRGLLDKRYAGSTLTYTVSATGRAVLAIDGSLPTSPRPAELTLLPSGDTGTGLVEAAPDEEPDTAADPVADPTTRPARDSAAGADTAGGDSATPRPPDNGSGGGGGGVAGLAREIEVLRARLDAVERIASQVRELADVVTRLAEDLADTTAATPDGSAPPSWLDFPTDTPTASEDAQDLLARLARWVGGVYLRYPDALASFPECWLWHPEVVEELLWLHHAWLAAYSEQAAASGVGDWHDRQRPGVLERIKDYAGACSLQAHLPGRDRHHAAPETPLVVAVAVVAAWWVTARDRPGPVPTEEQLTRADLAAACYTGSTHR
jgi:hypothetical protein